MVYKRKKKYEQEKIKFDFSQRVSRIMNSNEEKESLG